MSVASQIRPSGQPSRWWPPAAAWCALTTTGFPGLIRAAFDRLVWNVEPFRSLPLVMPQDAAKGETSRVEWLPPVNLAGRTARALSVPPALTVGFSIALPSRARIVTLCGVGPADEEPGNAAIVFDCEAEIPALGWTERRSLRLEPGRRPADRCWRRLMLLLPDPGPALGSPNPPVPGRLCGAEPNPESQIPNPGGVHAIAPAPTVHIRLTLRVPDGASVPHGPLLWGEPRLEARRSSSDMRLSLRGLIARLRFSGVSGVLRHIRSFDVTDAGTVGYHLWVQRNTPGPEALARMTADASAFAWRPRISVVVPVYETDPAWLRACIESVRRQAYPDWELCLADDGSTSSATLRVLDDYRSDPRIRQVRLPARSGISAASDAALALATGDYVALLDHDDELAPEALFDIVRVLNDAPDVDLIYTDEDKIAPSGARCDPFFKPDWSPEHLRSTMYLCHLLVARTSLVREVGGFRSGFDGAQDYDLALRISERTTRIHHLPRVLYHWRKVPGSTAQLATAKIWAHDSGARALQDHVARTGLEADVEPGASPGLYRVRHRIAGSPLVSIVIPTAGQTRRVNGRTVDLLAACVGSIEATSTWRHRELIVVDDGQLPASALAFLATVPHRRVSAPGGARFNFSARINLGAAHSRGSHLVLLNDDVEVITPEWIEAMLEFSQQHAIGAVGAKLLYPDGRLQHVGIVLGVCGVAAHPYHRYPGSTPGHGSSALIVRNYSAVTAACIMTRREVFERAGGFDPRFALDFNDIDYCLRLRRAGLRIVYTPYARLYHHEWSTSGVRRSDGHDADEVRQRWRETWENDPYYNPNLARDAADYRVRVT